jgi:transposase
MVHHREFCREIFYNLKDKGFLLPTLYEQDQILKKDLVGTIHRKKLINQKYV